MTIEVAPPSADVVCGIGCGCSFAWVVVVVLPPVYTLILTGFSAVRRPVAPRLPSQMVVRPNRLAVACLTLAAAAE